MLYICYYFGVCTPCGIEQGDNNLDLPLVTVHREHVAIVKPGRALNWLPEPEVATFGQQVLDEEIAMHYYQPNIQFSSFPPKLYLSNVLLITNSA